MKKTMVIGASDNPSRYSYLAVVSLQKHQHPIVPIGIKEGMINGIKILTGKPTVEGIDTVTLYVSPKHQPNYYDYILNLHPQRIIFNPGTENNELKKLAESKGIATVEGCTLVMLSIGTY